MQTLKFTQALHQQRLKLTRARMAVLEVLAGTTEHLKVAEVHRRARKIDPRVGLASVYRTMDILARLRLVKHVHVEHRHRHYASITEHHSHHLVCRSCGLAVEFSDCRLEGLARTIARRTDFEIEDHCVEFFGLCRKCRTRPNAAARRGNGKS